MHFSAPFIIEPNYSMPEFCEPENFPPLNNAYHHYYNSNYKQNIVFLAGIQSYNPLKSWMPDRSLPA